MARGRDRPCVRHVSDDDGQDIGEHETHTDMIPTVGGMQRTMDVAHGDPRGHRARASRTQPGENQS
jgi:hypothetical protein